jgi:hypothetical protein
MKNNKPKTWKAIVSYSVSKYLRGRKIYMEYMNPEYPDLGYHLSYSITNKIATIQGVDFRYGRFMLNVSYDGVEDKLWMLFNTPNVLFAD